MLIESQKLIQKLKEMLEDTYEFDNWECNYGHSLGTCPNKSCLHCRIYRLIKNLENGLICDETPEQDDIPMV